MSRLVLIALALAVLFNLAASQSLLIQNCTTVDCGSTCFNCPNATNVTQADPNTPLVLCPENGTFCFVKSLDQNGNDTLQNCVGCPDNSTNSSECTGCITLNESLSQDFCTPDGNCWSINYTAAGANATQNASNATNGTNGTNVLPGGVGGLGGENATNATNATACNCTNATTGLNGTNGTDINGNNCTCPEAGNATNATNVTVTPNGTAVSGNITAGPNGTINVVTTFGNSLQAVLTIVIVALASALLV